MSSKIKRMIASLLSISMATGATTMAAVPTTVQEEVTEVQATEETTAETIIEIETTETTDATHEDMAGETDTTVLDVDTDTPPHLRRSSGDRNTSNR